MAITVTTGSPQSIDVRILTTHMSYTILSYKIIKIKSEEFTMSKIEKVLVTGKTHTSFSGAGNTSRGHNGSLDIELSSPGNAKPAHVFAATQPHPTAEQLFAGAWSACYIAAVGLAAKELKVALPSDTSVDIEVDLGQTGNAYFLQARFNVRLPDLPHNVATAIAHAADEMCPYSKATRGNIDVALNVITA
jgi:Ohr subfamily peroxiredoxin